MRGITSHDLTPTFQTCPAPAKGSKPQSMNADAIGSGPEPSLLRRWGGVKFWALNSLLASVLRRTLCAYVPCCRSAGSLSSLSP